MKKQPLCDMGRLQYIKATGGLDGFRRMSLHQRINFYPFSMIISRTFRKHSAELAAMISTRNSMLKALLRD